MDLQPVKMLLALVGVEADALEDEHVRWDVYRRALDRPESFDLLRACIAGEDDRTLASSVVVLAMEKVGRSDRERWVRVLGPEASGFAARRCRELGVLEDILSGEHPLDQAAAEAMTWSDWLQFRIAGASREPRVLNILAAEGRTKRIRRLAWESRERR